LTTGAGAGADRAGFGCGLDVAAWDRLAAALDAGGRSLITSPGRMM
jgi:hypothetical protein